MSSVDAKNGMEETKNKHKSRRNTVKAVAQKVACQSTMPMNAIESALGRDEVQKLSAPSGGVLAVYRESNGEQIAELYNEVRSIILSARRKVHAAVNSAMVEAYWLIGKSIVEMQGGVEKAKYGDGLIAGLAVRLSAEFGKAFDDRELRRMRQFSLLFPIRDALRPELGWTHYRSLLAVGDEKARMWYMNEAANETWSTRQLQRQISVLYYERMLASPAPDETRADARTNIANANLPVETFIKSPYVLDFLGLGDYPAVYESDIEQGIISHIGEFLLELGKGFCFVARQKRIEMEDRDFYVDLVFYNNILKCYVLIDLKLGELTYQDIGQMDGYVRLYEEKFRREDDNPTIGLLLCSKKNEAVARYSVLNESKQLFASKYLLQLPSEEDLRLEIERERRLIEARADNAENTIPKDS